MHGHGKVNIKWDSTVLAFEVFEVSLTVHLYELCRD